MEKNVLISLCMPTNGVIEWVFPVLDSIFGQGVDDNLFEVVVTVQHHFPMLVWLLRIMAIMKNLK